ncbi:MAG: F0F1 ATP synthase subunit A [Bacteroidetes bacterium]|nr:F0F1 ATP synthase subunit A [Bacteroidota bacterium]MDA0903830.1 F0F1 ATP synthase subunit A [Bacteroidota bacterium]MDA1242876.1 F0F1 ATP synthase subunit A [Bacteroidota bacterium]
MSTRFNLFFLATGLLIGQVMWGQHGGQDSHEAPASHNHEEGHDHLEGDGKSGFDPSPFIIHHVADAHDIHLWGEGESAVHIPLPIILYSQEFGLDVFMSSAFHGHGDVKYTEDGKYALSHGHISLAGDGAHDDHADHGHADHGHDASHGHDGGSGVYDFSITKSVFGMLLILTLLVVLFGRAAASYRKNPGQGPKGLANVLEPLVIFVRDDIAVPSLGEKKAAKFLPFLLTVFFFILFANLLGLIPFIGGFNITGTVSITMVMAFFVFLLTTLNGNKHYWGHLFWPPGVPVFVMPIIIPIEIIGMFLKPIVLMIRLTANITAGHIIILSFVSLILIFGESSAVAGYGVGVFSTAFMIFMYCIELLVAFLQAFIFTLLAAIYFGEATHEAHH